MNKGFLKVREAVKSAFSRIRPPEVKDEQLVQYSRLKPSDFTTLIQKHGEEKVLQYIKDMEYRRSKNAR